MTFHRADTYRDYYEFWHITQASRVASILASGFQARYHAHRCVSFSVNRASARGLWFTLERLTAMDNLEHVVDYFNGELGIPLDSVEDSIRIYLPGALDRYGKENAAAKVYQQLSMDFGHAGLLPNRTETLMGDIADKYIRNRNDLVECITCTLDEEVAATCRHEPFPKEIMFGDGSIEAEWCVSDQAVLDQIQIKTVGRVP